MRLKEAISVLSKSSPYAVSTERSSQESGALDEIKGYLYIEMPIALDVEATISSFSANTPEVLFLCGSSGDGKSEILTDCKKKFEADVDFHLDATHSFSPKENAIQTLDNLFNRFEKGSRPLVVGINTGMLGNYAEEGNNDLFKTSIKNFLDGSPFDNQMHFIDFESYPKFSIEGDTCTSEFVEKLLGRVTASENNPIRNIFDYEKNSQTDIENSRLQANYELLSIPEVQLTVIDLLFKSRLFKDQFLTARALLDFVYILLAGPGYLFENLFSGGDNELANKIIDFDPAHIRTKNIDRFILASGLGLVDRPFDEFKADLKKIGVEPLEHNYSYLRLFYLLKNYSFSNNYHQGFVEDFDESLVTDYLSIYQMHRDFSNENSEAKKRLKSFYNNTLRAAIRKYNNRNASFIGKDYYLISIANDHYYLAAKLDIKFDAKSISKHPPKSPSSFTACLLVDEKPLTINVNINLLKLMKRIVDGYRPNKHDKNTVVLLDELVEEIAQVANQTTTLHVFNNGQNIAVKQVDDELEVSGI